MIRHEFTFRVWSHDYTERLRELWWAGFSADQIALLLDLTSQQVKDKAHREALKRNPELKVVMVAVAPDPVLREGEPITMSNVCERECRWIYDAPTATAQMCGNVVKDKQQGPWCEFHLGRLRG